MHDELVNAPSPVHPVQGPLLPERAARVVANALDLAEQALAHQDVAMAADALELAELVRSTNGRLLPDVVDLHDVSAAAHRVVRGATT